MFASDNGFGVISKSKNLRCCNRNVAANDRNMVCCNNLIKNIVYYVDSVGKNRRAIAEYIRNQLVEYKKDDHLTLKEFYDPFMGEPNRKDK